MAEFKAKSAAEMRKLAEAARGNIWKVKKGANSHCFDLRIDTGLYTTVAFADEPEASFIAACAPSQITAMCDLIEAQARRIEVALRALRHALEFAEAEQENRGHAGSEMSDYVGEADECVAVIESAIDALLTPGAS